jgi:hypothetical protein
MISLIIFSQFIMSLEGIMSRKYICIYLVLLFFALSMISADTASANFTLNITSSYPDSGASFAFRPNGHTDWQGGATPYGGSFSNGTQLEIVVPFVAYSAGRNIFGSINGCDSVSYWSDDPSLSNSIICTVTMNTNKTITFHYSMYHDNMSFPGDTSIFWQNQVNGDVMIWNMDGTTKYSAASSTTLPLQWHIVGVADFNSDGKPDMVMHNQSTGDYYLYYMDGRIVLGGQSAGKVSNNNWQLVGIADFNNDSGRDYLWQNHAEGKGYIWLQGFDDWHGLIVKGGQELGNDYQTTATAYDWNIVGTGDFNQDGYQDIVLQNPTNGYISFWFLNGTAQVQSEALLAGKVDVNWKVVGISDFNKDGKPDLLWRNQTTGDNEVWFMDGTTKTGSSLIDNEADTTWEIVGVIPALSLGSYKLPHTGPMMCYNEIGDVMSCPLPGDSFAQDGSYYSNPLSYTDNDNGTVTDNNTGLIWQKEDDFQPRMWDEAKSYCDNLSLNGYSDWRLPAKKELNSIVDYGIPFPGPVIDDIFTNTKISNYWTSNRYSYNPDYAWYVYFADGFVSFHYVYSAKFNPSIYVRCLRGRYQPLSSFVNNGDGTVSDNLTGLIWQQDETNTMSWEAALSYCEGLSLGNHSDWRLPNIKELGSLTDDMRYFPAIDTNFFPDAQPSNYWSSTTNTYMPGFAWGLDFNSGENFSRDKSSSNYHVRCVRGGR